MDPDPDGLPSGWADLIDQHVTQRGAGLLYTAAKKHTPEFFRSVEHHILGNRMRLRHETTIALDEKWRTMLDERALAAFDTVAGPMNRRYGYA